MTSQVAVLRVTLNLIQISNSPAPTCVTANQITRVSADDNENTIYFVFRKSNTKIGMLRRSATGTADTCPTRRRFAVEPGLTDRQTSSLQPCAKPRDRRCR